MSYSDILVIVMCLTALMVLGVSLLMLKVVKFYVKEATHPTLFATAEEKEAKRLEEEALLALIVPKPSLFNKIMGLRPIAEEEELIMEHKFDGIEELNNPTPAWFSVLFYGTIIFAVLYMLNYEVFGFGPSQEQEYATELEKAETDKVAFLSKPGNAKNAVDENNIVQSKDVAIIHQGAALFKTRCTPCHGQYAEGIVGPNLTDEYWLHGGSIKEVFKTIKYGVPEKGMIAWEKSISAQQIADLANYVLSLQGSKPTGAKAPQGDKIK